MKYDRTEIAPSGKPRLRIFLSEDDAEILDGLAKAALAHMPETLQTSKTIQRLRSMRRCFKGIKSDAVIPATANEAPPDLEGILRKIMAYKKGDPPYRFSGMRDMERSIAALEAWERIELEIEDALHKCCQ